MAVGGISVRDGVTVAVAVLVNVPVGLGVRVNVTEGVNVHASLGLGVVVGVRVDVSVGLLAAVNPPVSGITSSELSATGYKIRLMMIGNVYAPMLTTKNTAISIYSFAFTSDFPFCTNKQVNCSRVKAHSRSRYGSNMFTEQTHDFRQVVLILCSEDGILVCRISTYRYILSPCASRLTSMVSHMPCRRHRFEGGHQACLRSCCTTIRPVSSFAKIGATRCRVAY